MNAKPTPVRGDGGEMVGKGYAPRPKDHEIAAFVNTLRDEAMNHWKERGRMRTMLHKHVMDFIDRVWEPSK